VFSHGAVGLSVGESQFFFVKVDFGLSLLKDSKSLVFFL
jgi:hypothetical protein